MAEANRRNEILTAARHVFASDGYTKASIKKIAQEANLKSSALIYWYFENKEALFQAVISHNVPLTQLADEAELLFQQPPEIVLPELLRRHIGALDEEEMRQLIKIVIPELLRNPEISDNFSVLINPIFDMIRQYLQQQIDNGRFRPHDTSISTRTLLSITIVYALNEMLLPGLGRELPNRDTYLEEAVNMFIRGLEM